MYSVTRRIRLNVLFLTCVLQASAALCVNAGSLLDPDDLPGLAHYLEHSKPHCYCISCIWQHIGSQWRKLQLASELMVLCKLLYSSLGDNIEIKRTENNNMMPVCMQHTHVMIRL